MPNKATNEKQDACHQTLGAGLIALTPNKATMKNRMHLAEPSGLLYGLAAFTTSKAAAKNGMHLTGP